mgnify:FL=1
MPKKLKAIIGAEKPSKRKEIVDVRGLVQEQLQEQKAKSRRQKVVINIEEIKATSGGFTFPFSRQQYEREQSQYPLVLIDEVITSRKASPIVDIREISKLRTTPTSILSQFTQPTQRAQQRQSSLPKQFQIPRQEQRQFQIPRTDVKPIVDVKPIQEQRQIQETKPILDITQITEQKRKFPFRDIITKVPPPPPFKFPKFEGGRKLKPSKLFSFKPKSQYVASVVAGIKGIYGRKPKVITNIGIRPLLRSFGRKRKRR